MNFKDNARQAMEFYQSVLGGELTLSTFGESQMSSDASEIDLIMHGQLSTPTGITLMGADTPAAMEWTPGYTNFSISLSGDDDAELRGYWAKLTATGTAVMPLEVAPWGDAFGMCLDQFGVSWMINITGTQSSHRD